MPLSFAVTCDVDIPMRDGTRLRADLWRPELAGRRPAILFRTPYGKSRLVSDFFSPKDAASNGFVAVVQDARGRFASEGEWQAFAWEQEGRDSYDSVEWAAQQPWCSGAVGMAGYSYLGIVQLVGAALRPPHLKAIAPAIASVAKHEKPEHGGALWLDHLFSWLGLMTYDWAARRRAAGHVFTADEEAILARCLGDARSVMTVRPLQASPLFQIRGFPAHFARVAQSAATPEIDVHKIDVPILAVGGWYDFYLRGTIGLFQDVATPDASKRHLIVGPWAHASTLPFFQGQANFGLAASGAAALLPEHHVAFFRRYLLGETVDVPRVKYFLMHSGQWKFAESWPPPATTTRRLFLRSRGLAHLYPSDGLLLESAPEGDEPHDEYTYDPDDPPPSIGGRLLATAGLLPGPIDQTSLVSRTDTLSYDGASQDKAVDLIGPVRATLSVSSNAADTDFVCKLIDVAPSGVALPITDGIVRMRWRNGYEQPAPYTPGLVESITVDLAHVAWRLRAGHRLRLQIQSGNFPHIDANLNTDEPTGLGVRGVVARNRVLHDAARLSYLDLPQTPKGE